MNWADVARSVAKALAGAVVGGATYVLTQGVQLDDPAYWAGLVVFIGAGYGIVWAAPANKPK
jgi:hypothetical protein